MSNLINRSVVAYVNDASNAPEFFRSENVGITPVQVTGAGNNNSINLYGYNLYNPNIVDVFFKLSENSVIPVVGTTPVKQFYMVPAGGSVVLEGSDILIHFSDLMWAYVTTGVANANAVAPALGCYIQLTIKS